MSRSKRKSPVFPVTCSESEAKDKAEWHRRHRREERERLKVEGSDYVPRSYKEHSSPWTMDKDGKIYWGNEASPREMRK